MFPGLKHIYFICFCLFSLFPLPNRANCVIFPKYFGGWTGVLSHHLSPHLEFHPCHRLIVLLPVPQGLRGEEEHAGRRGPAGLSLPAARAGPPQGLPGEHRPGEQDPAANRKEKAKAEGTTHWERKTQQRTEWRRKRQKAKIHLFSQRGVVVTGAPRLGFACEAQNVVSTQPPDASWRDHWDTASTHWEKPVRCTESASPRN